MLSPILLFGFNLLFKETRGRRAPRGNKEVVGGVRCLDMEVFTAQVMAEMREEALESFLAYLTMPNVQKKSKGNIFSEGLAQEEGG